MKFETLDISLLYKFLSPKFVLCLSILLLYLILILLLYFIGTHVSDITPSLCRNKINLVSRLFHKFLIFIIIIVFIIIID